MKYFRLTNYGQDIWFAQEKTTIGKIYTFPCVTWDEGRIQNLNEDVGLWEKEMIFVSEKEYLLQNNVLYNYEIY